MPLLTACTSCNSSLGALAGFWNWMGEQVGRILETSQEIALRQNPQLSYEAGPSGVRIYQPPTNVGPYTVSPPGSSPTERIVTQTSSTALLVAGAVIIALILSGGRRD